MSAGKHQRVVLWTTRFVVALVCFFNLTAAIPFVANPAGHLFSFGVEGCGIGGEVLVRGLGIAFLMWQVPFFPVIWHPGRHRVCFVCVLVMQLVGLIGEILMMAGLPGGHQALRATGWRFIVFDGGGLLGMGVMYALLHLGSRGAE